MIFNDLYREILSSPGRKFTMPEFREWRLLSSNGAATVFSFHGTWTEFRTALANIYLPSENDFDEELCTYLERRHWHSREQMGDTILKYSNYRFDKKEEYLVTHHLVNLLIGSPQSQTTEWIIITEMRDEESLTSRWLLPLDDYSEDTQHKFWETHADDIWQAIRVLENLIEFVAAVS